MEGALSLDKLATWFEDSEDATADARKLSERDRDYVDGNQLTEEETAELKRRGQPAVVMNQIRRKVNWMRGLEAQRRTDPKGFARNPSHQQGADAMTDALRFVADNTNFDATRSDVWDNLLVEGFGGAEVIHTEVRGRAEIEVNHYHWDRLFYDPHSRKADFSDARYKGAVVWADAGEVGAEFPKAKGKLDEMVAISSSQASASDTLDDRPRDNAWLSRDRQRVRIVLMWYRHKGDWHWSLFTGSVELSGGKSPYVDEDGDSISTLILQSMYVDRNNNRYGMVRDFISPQDEINKRRSKALWQSTSNQTMGEKGTVDSVSVMKREKARPDGHIETNPDKKLEFIPTSEQVSVHLALLQEAKGEIEAMGAASVLAGEAGESTSGRAVLARQQGGLVEVAPLFDALANFSRNIHRHIWWMVKQTWTEERWIRVTDDDRNTRFVGINQLFTVRDQLQELPEDQALEFARQEGLQPDDPRLSQVLEIRNNVEEMDIDVVVEEVPETISVQGETFDALVKLAPTIQPAVAPVYSELLIEMAPLRADARDRLLDAMKAAQEAVAPLQGAEAEAGARKAIAEAVQAENEAQGPGELPTIEEIQVG